MANLETLLDIVVPMYNLSGYLEKSLANLAKQDYDNYHVILVDDHSSDDTLAIAQDFSKAHPQFELIQLPEHQGASAARNAGIEAATGIGVAFVDGDDQVDPEYASKLAEGLINYSADIAAVGYTWFGPVSYRSFDRLRFTRWDEISKPNMLDSVTRHGTEVGGYIWNKAFRRSLLNDAKVRFDTQLQIAEDYLFTTEAAAAGNKFVYYAKALYHKVNRPGSTIHSRTYKMRVQEEEVFAKMGEIARNSLRH